MNRKRPNNSDSTPRNSWKAKTAGKINACKSSKVAKANKRIRKKEIWKQIKGRFDAKGKDKIGKTCKVRI